MNKSNKQGGGKTRVRRIPLKPESWWVSAQEAYLAAKALRDADLVMPCMSYCHSMVEKALKAACAEEHKLNHDDANHGLVRLARKAGIYNSLSKKMQTNLFHLSSMRERTNYPSTEFRFEVSNDPGTKDRVYGYAAEIYLFILKRYERVGQNKKTIRDSSESDDN